MKNNINRIFGSLDPTVGQLERMKKNIEAKAAQRGGEHRGSRKIGERIGEEVSGHEDQHGEGPEQGEDQQGISYGGEGRA